MVLFGVISHGMTHMLPFCEFRGFCPPKPSFGQLHFLAYSESSCHGASSEVFFCRNPPSSSRDLGGGGGRISPRKLTYLTNFSRPQGIGFEMCSTLIFIRSALCKGLNVLWPNPEMPSAATDRDVWYLTRWRLCPLVGRVAWPMWPFPGSVALIYDSDHKAVWFALPASTM